MFHLNFQVNQEVENARETTSRLAQVEKDMMDVVSRIRAIQDTAGAAIAAIERIKNNIDSIARAAEEATSACQQASSAANQQGQAMENLASTAEQIAAQADAL